MFEKRSGFENCKTYTEAEGEWKEICHQVASSSSAIVPETVAYPKQCSALRDCRAPHATISLHSAVTAALDKCAKHFSPTQKASGVSSANLCLAAEAYLNNERMQILFVGYSYAQGQWARFKAVQSLRLLQSKNSEDSTFCNYSQYRRLGG